MVMPRYNHDCDKCVFLGEYEEYDLYFCGQGTLLTSTVIARYSNNGEDYTSGIDFATHYPPLIEAKSRAIEKGLLF
jgi:hypothetical protein